MPFSGDKRVEVSAFFHHEYWKLAGNNNEPSHSLQTNPAHPVG